MWHVNDDGAVPPLPKAIFPGSPNASGLVEVLKPGCWVLRLDPAPSDDFNPRRNLGSPLKGWTVSYVGTIRVGRETRSSQAEGQKAGSDPGAEVGIRASGDLYVERQDWSIEGSKTPPPLLRPRRIPIFPRAAYVSYFTIKEFASDPKTLVFSVFRYHPEDFSWGSEEILSATLKETREGDPVDELRWTIRNELGSIVADLRIAWISKKLRRAKIDFAVATGIEAPLNNGCGTSIKSVYRDVGWQIRVPQPIEAEGPPEVWQLKDLHKRMLELRRAANLDREWVYHVLVVPRWSELETYRFGMMFDVGALDTNLVPREGLVVAATAKFDDEDPSLGSARGQRLQDVPKAAFHNLMHELGHAMGLLHRFYGRSFMQALLFIAFRLNPTPDPRGSSARPDSDQTFPDNLIFSYEPEDVLRLRHHPDPWVRPGGIPFRQGTSALPVPDADAITEVGDQLELRAKPLRRRIPLGAPVRIQLRLTNITRHTLPGPQELSLSAGSIAGRVIGPDRHVHRFSAAAPIDYLDTQNLAPGASLFQSETLLRGPEGALFPEPGRYRIEVDAGWVGPGGIARVGTALEVVITAPRTRRHGKVARRALAAEGLAILLVFRPDPGEEHLPGNEAILTAIKVLHQALDTSALRDGFASLEARRLAASDLPAAARLIRKSSLLATNEIEALLTLVQDAKKKVRKLPEVRRLIKICRLQAERAVLRNLAPRSLLELALDLERWP